MERRRIGRFEVERVLGQGGMGVVYVARDALLDRRVALKVLPPGQEEDTEDRRRLLREARSAAALSHPNVATVLEAGEDGGAVYLAMELVEGETLAERIARGSIPEADVVRIGLGIARGLASAHASGVLHRDLKPANVILGPELTPKLVDFGLARSPKSQVIEDRTSYTGVVAGTPGYMAPEQVRGGATDARTDVFALGVVLHELWAGTPPFGGTGLAAMSAVLYDEPAPLEARRAGAPHELRELVRRCLSRDPEQRPADASVAVRVLASLAARATDSVAIDPAPSGARPMAIAPTIEVVRASVRPRESVSSLVGRDRELDAVEALLDDGRRLVTVTGPPGIGKTRLATELARRARERGVRTTSIALGSARTVADLEAAVTAGLRRAAGAGTLAELLAIEDGLVLLDGAEALGDPLGACLESWLRAAPSLRIVVVSRVVLRAAPSEDVVRLAALPEAVAVELFGARARKTKPLLVLEGVEREAVLEIARLLDGNPLALTLAAARVAVLAPSQIAKRLRERAHDRLALLQDRSVTGLAEAIGWSFQLLDADARTLAIDLSVLVGAFDAETAEAIATNPDAVLEGLERLRDASLLRAVDGDGALLAMDPNVRAFALRELEARGDAPARRDAHLRWYGSVAERALTSGAASARSVAAMQDDLVLAMRHAAATPSEAALAPGLWASALTASFAEAHDPAALEEVLVSLLARDAPSVGPALRARATLGLARARRSRDPALATDDARAAIALAVAANDARLAHRARMSTVDALIARSAIVEARAEIDAAAPFAKDVDAEIDVLEKLATVQWRTSQLDEALVSMRRALALVEARRDRRRQADVLSMMGIVCVQRRRFDEARAAYERARELARAEGAWSLMAALENNLGVIHHELDRLDDARACYVEGAAHARRSGRAMLFAVAHGNVGFVAQERGARAEARLAFDEAIATLAAVGDARYRAVFVLARANVLADDGEHDRARAEIAAAQALALESAEPQMQAVLAIRSAYVDHACATTPSEAARTAAVLRSHLAELDRPDSIVARSDLCRMALRLARRAVTSE